MMGWVSGDDGAGEWVGLMENERERPGRARIKLWCQKNARGGMIGTGVARESLLSVSQSKIRPEFVRTSR